MNQEYRVVFDTSTIIGALINPSSQPGKALDFALENHILSVSQETLDELY